MEQEKKLKLVRSLEQQLAALPQGSAPSPRKQSRAKLIIIIARAARADERKNIWLRTLL